MSECIELTDEYAEYCQYIEIPEVKNSEKEIMANHQIKIKYNGNEYYLFSYMSHNGLIYQVVSNKIGKKVSFMHGTEHGGGFFSERTAVDINKPLSSSVLMAVQAIEEYK
jgi:hypothetical protein